MIVRLRNVGRTTRVGGRPFALLDGLNLEIRQGEHVGILGLPKSGKSTLLRIICGTESVDTGEVYRGLKTSWPIPLASFFIPSSSVAWNIRSVARIYGVSDRNFVGRVGELGGISGFLNRPISACPPFVRQQLAFALGIGMDFGLYLFDKQAIPPGKDFKERALEHFREQTKDRAVLIATSAPQALADLCDSIYVLESGRARCFATSEEAVEYFKPLLKAEAGRKKGSADKSDEVAEDLDSASDESDASMDQIAVVASDL